MRHIFINNFPLVAFFQLFVRYEEDDIPRPHSQPGGHEAAIKSHETLVADGLLWINEKDSLDATN